MKEQLCNEIMAELIDKISNADLQSIQNKIHLILKDYDVKRITKELTTYIDYTPNWLNMFYVAKRIENVKASTLTNYSFHLKEFFNYIHKPVEQIGVNDIRSYLAYEKFNKNVKDSTLNNKRAALSSMFSWASAEKYLTHNPMSSIKPIKSTNSAPREALSPIELEKLRMTASTNLRDRAMVEFFYSTGCRVSEMVDCNISDIDFDKRTVTLLGKGEKYRTNTFSTKCGLFLVEYLNSRKDTEEALFVSSRGHKRLSRAGIERIIKNLGLMSGIGNLYPHKIRHTTATSLLQNGMPIDQVQMVMGHTSINTTEIYAKTSKDSVNRNLNRFLL